MDLKNRRHFQDKEGRKKLRKNKDDNIAELLKMVAPGTPIRDRIRKYTKSKNRCIIVNNRQYRSN